jgi:hypothetical protein
MADTYFEDATHKTVLVGDEAIGATSDPGGSPADVYITPVDIYNYFSPFFGYTLLAEFTTHLDPADSTDYFFGSFGSLSAATSATFRKIFIPRTGTITAVIGHIVTISTGSAENNTLAVRLNDTTDTTVSSTISITGTLTDFSKTDLSIAVTQGDFIEMKFTTPAYATNPEDVKITCQILVE